MLGGISEGALFQRVHHRNVEGTRLDIIRRKFLGVDTITQCF